MVHKRSRFLEQRIKDRIFLKNKIREMKNDLNVVEEDIQQRLVKHGMFMYLSVNWQALEKDHHDSQLADGTLPHPIGVPVED